MSSFTPSSGRASDAAAKPSLLGPAARKRKAQVKDAQTAATTETQAVIDAAREWRRVYWAWLQRPAPRDLTQNGENLALSGLLDALDALDKAEAEASPIEAFDREFVPNCDTEGL